MVIVPFVYFSFLIYFLLKRNRGKFDIACYILSVFAVSGLFSMLMVYLDMEPREFGSYQVSFVATFFYCGLITLCTYPFIKYSNLKIGTIRPVKNVQLLKILAIVFFVFFVFDTLMNFRILYNILTGDFGEYRVQHYKGDDEVTWVASYPYIVRVIVQYLHFIVGSPWVLTFLAFFVILIQNMPYRYGLMFFVASLIGIVGNLLSAGRSDIIYWLISVGACFVFFSPYISKNQWKKIGLVLIPFVLVFVGLFLMTTMSKFEGHEEVGNLDAGSTSIIAYAGQPFLYFCFFFDKFTCPLPSLEAIFPYTYYLTGNGHTGIVALQEAISAKSPYELGVFYTFIGQIAVTSSNVVAIIYCICVTLLSSVFICRTKRRAITMNQAYFYMLFASVLFLGLFSHYYAILTKTFSVIAFSFIFWLLNIRSKNGRKT